MTRTARLARPLAFGCLAVVLAALPRAAEACSVCTTGTEDNTRGMFLITTLVMSTLPLAMVGVFLFWLRRRMRALARVEAALSAVRATN